MRSLYPLPNLQSPSRVVASAVTGHVRSRDPCLISATEATATSVMTAVGARSTYLVYKEER